MPYRLPRPRHGRRHVGKRPEERVPERDVEDVARLARIIDGGVEEGVIEDEDLALLPHQSCIDHGQSAGGRPTGKCDRGRGGCAAGQQRAREGAREGRFGHSMPQASQLRDVRLRSP